MNIALLFPSLISGPHRGAWPDCWSPQSYSAPPSLERGRCSSSSTSKAF